MALVFISHASFDNQYSSKVFQLLKEEGFDYLFLDYDEKDGIYMGEEWEKRLYREIQRSHVFLILLSPKWLESKWCHTEYQWAKALGKELIPVVVEQGENGEVNKWIDQHIQKSDLTQDPMVLSRVISRIKEIAIRTQKGFRWDPHRTPYPGLGAFSSQDAAVFFGREEETLLVIEKLHGMQNKNSPKLLNIAAASGMGKSSLLRAGILPKLSLSYKERWHLLPVLRPQKRPLYEVSILFAKYLGREESYKEIYQKLLSTEIEETIDDLITDIQLKEGKCSILIPVDQAEELFTLSETHEREAFLRMMTYLLAKDGVFSIWTMRSDYLPQMQNHKALYDLLEMQEIFILKPMSTEHIRDVIIKPAEVAGTIVEEKLVDRLKEDMETTDALPLLALTLHELYVRYAKEGKLTLQHYRLLGGDKSSNPLEGIIERVADETVAKCQKTVQCLQSLKQAFIPSLVKIKEDDSGFVKKVANWEELPQKAYDMINALVDARLLVKKQHEGTVTIEIAHEALIRQWSLLKMWLEEEDDFLRTKAQVESAYEEWSRANKTHKALLTGLQLEKALSFKDKLQGNEKEYVIQSQKYAQSRQAQKRRLIFFVVLILSLLSIFSGWQWYEAKAQSKIAHDKVIEAKVQRMIAQKAFKEANRRFMTIDAQRNDMLGVFWMLLLNKEIDKNGKINNIDRVTKILTKLDANETEKSRVVDILYTYFSKVGLHKEFDEDILLNNFDAFYTKLVFRKGKYVAMEMKVSTNTFVWLWDDTQKRALITLLDILTRKKLPKIFQRYSTLSQEDRKTFLYVHDILSFSLEPNEKKLINLLKYPQIRTESLKNGYQGMEVLLGGIPFLKYAQSTKEFNDLEWINIVNNALQKTINISRTLYQYMANTNNNIMLKSKIKELYFYGIYDFNMEENQTRIDQISSDDLKKIPRYLTPYVYKKRATELFETGDLKGAQRSLKNILSIQNDNYWALDKLSNIGFIEQDKAKYREILHRMIELFPTEKDYLKRKLKIFDFIATDGTSCTLSDKEKTTATGYYTFLSHVLFKLGKQKEAVVWLKKGEKLLGDRTKEIEDIYGSLSWYMLFEKDYAGAIEYAEKTLHTNPSERYVLTNLAHAKLLMGDIEGAKKIYLENTGITVHDKKWSDIIHEDFNVLKSKGIESPYFGMIAKMLANKKGAK